MIPTSPRSAQLWWGSCVGLTLELLCAQIEAQELVSHDRGVSMVWKE